MKIGTLSHIKTKRLKRRLGLPMYQVAGILETLWHLAIESADEGDIGKFSNDDIAMGLEWDGDADALISALIDSGFVDEDPERRLVIHDWLDHAPEYVRERLRKREARHRKKESQPVREVPGQQRTMPGHVPPLSGTVPQVSAEVPPSSEVVPSIPCHIKPNPTNPNQTSSPTSPQSAQQPVRSSTGEPATWAEVGEAMKSLKISRREQTMKAGQKHGFNPAQVLAIIDYLQALPTETCESPAGALCDRLNTEDAADWDCNENWPWSTADKAAPSPYDVPANVAAADAKRLESESLERNRKYAAAGERRELTFGEKLNAMSSDDLMLLIGSAEQVKRDFLKRGYQTKGRDSPEVRYGLLEALEALEQRKELAVAS
ncbi:MAG TPA: hypothetical protein VGM98_11195 [Schlesneria sp.]|jgi:hypothetical protein